MKRIALFVLAVACGSSETPGPPAKSAEEKARDARVEALAKLEKERPVIPYVVDQTHVYSVARDCGQGPFRVEVKSLGAEHGERIEVYACATARGLQGRSRVTVDGREEPARSFGYLNGTDDHCVATASDLARVGDAGAAPVSSTTAPKGVTAHAPTATAQGEKLTEKTDVVIAEGKECPAGASYVEVGSYAVITTQGRAMEPNRPLSIEIWSDVPSDFRDVVFVARQWRVKTMTQDAWSDLLRRDDEYWKKFAAFEKANDDLFVHDAADAGAAEPPPPARAETQPPRPSVHATWVPGYYKKSAASWIWSAGFWRVPDEDVERELTTVAPAAPPPPRDESLARAAAPAPDAVWTEGSWQWDGARWVWVEGAWRLPPAPTVIWQPPRWAPHRGRFVLVPGGWSRRR